MRLTLASKFRLSLAFFLKGNYIVSKEYLAGRELPITELLGFHKIIHILPRHLEVSHHVAHAHEFWEVVHINRP